MDFDFIIIDSGIDKNNEFLIGYSDICCEYLPPNSIQAIKDDVDVCGHGTTVASMIKTSHPNAAILSLRIFDCTDGNIHSSESRLIDALRYINNMHTAKVINMSCDIVAPTRLEELSDITYQLARKGTILVSSHQNQGGFSYPASFEWVIGVADDVFRPLKTEISFCQDTRINIIDSVKFVRMLGDKTGYKSTYGCSFSCARISSIAYTYKQQGAKDIKDVLLCFEKDFPSQENTFAKSPSAPQFEIKKAIVFPFNKEIHSIVRYAKDLPFDLIDVYDVKQLLHIGKSTQDILNDTSVPFYVIKNINNIDWDTFDTLILGCVTEINKLLNKDDWLSELINNALCRGKNIYAFEEIFDDAQLKYNNVYVPIVNKDSIPPPMGYRLFRTAIPIIGIYGTGSQQGKFTLQMLLRKEFQKIGCRVGQIGTEPSAPLFGMDYVFPMGYHSSIYADENEKILYSNNLLWKVAEKNPDIIIVGSQMGTVPRRYENLMYSCHQTYAFLQGIKPDYAIVTVSIEDSIEYIQRTINFLESLTETKVLALVLFPLCNTDFNNDISPAKRHISENEYLNYKTRIERELNVPLFLLGNDDLPNNLMNVLLSELEK